MRTQLSTQPVLFIQGAGGMHQPEGSGRLAAYLARELGTGYRVIAPEMPDAENPRYQPWRDRIERELDAIDEAVILVGHSFGGSVLLKYLAQGSYQKPIRGLFLVSVPNWGARRMGVRRIRGARRHWLEAARIEDLPVPQSR